MFRFGFLDEDGESSPLHGSPRLKGDPEPQAPVQSNHSLSQPAPFGEFIPSSSDTVEASPTVSFHEIHFDGYVLKKVIESDFNKIDESNQIFDIIPSVYEGGHSLWECTIDLLNYISKAQINDAANRTLIELGCGHGLPGCLALLKNFREVVFSDFNLDVISNTTFQNVLLNSGDRLVLDRVKFYFGDWTDLSQKISMKKFDYIIAAETLYTVECCEKIFRFLDRHLSDQGIGLLATKRFYFGVGGGSFEIERLVSRSSTLEIRCVQSIETGSSNIRDILQVTRKKNPSFC